MIEYINTLDLGIIHAVQSIGPAWYDTAWLLSFVIGSTKWLAPGIILILLVMGKKRTALEMFVIFAVSAVFLFGIKHLIDSPRPYQVESAVIAYTTETDSGMPSGHAFMSIVILSWLWFRHPKSFIFSVGGGFLILLIGLSRIYLGVHYPSQVVAGWVLGALFLWLLWWVDRIYFRSRSSYVEKARKKG